MVGAKLGGMYEQKPLKRGVTMEKGVLPLCNGRAKSDYGLDLFLLL